MSCVRRTYTRLPPCWNACKDAMSATLVTKDCEGPITRIGRFVVESSVAAGELTLFFFRMLGWMLTHLPRRPVLFLCMYQIGVQSLSVVMITGGFIGMVM